MTEAIVGSIFIVLSLIWTFVDWAVKRNAKYEEAKSDLQKAIDNHDTAGLIDSQRRMRLYR
jgi:hypothetical protein